MKNRFWKKKNKRSAIILGSPEAYDILCADGYTPLNRNTEIVTACRKISEMISCITIHLMQNTENGDMRVINELSRKIDITPCRHMTRKTFMEAVVMNLLLYGKGNSIVKPYTRDGYLEDLEPISACRVQIQGDYSNYRILIDGIAHDPDDLLHFVFNPDDTYMYKGKGVTAQLKDVADNLRQAQATTKGFLKSKWKPSLIIKVDAMADEFASEKGRDRLLNEYISNNETGKPWIIPAEQFQIEQVKPLSLEDLAISDTVKIDKQTIASVLGVPSFVLGVGNYNSEEWNSFIKNTVRPIVTSLQQEMTKKLIYSPNMYIKFNTLSLMDWDIEKISKVFGSLSDKGYVTGNEVRDKLGMSPLEGLDELRVLENYIPVDMIGLQKKLIQEGDD